MPWGYSNYDWPLEKPPTIPKKVKHNQKRNKLAKASRRNNRKH